MSRFHSLAALLLLAVQATACDRAVASDDRAPDEVPEAERYGGTAVIAHTIEIPTVNPLFTREMMGREIQQFVLFTPVLRLTETVAPFPVQKLDEKFEPAPALARSWEMRPISADTSELTLHLRDDVYWHDGIKTTAWDLKFSYDLSRTPPIGSPQSFPYYGDAEVVDSFTFRVKLRPHVDHLQAWRNITALPRHILEEAPAEELEHHPFGTEHPVGNGPFRFVSRVKGESWTFEANPRYPKELGGRPYLDRIVYRVIPDQEAALEALLGGSVDYLLSLPAEQARQVKESATTQLVTFPSQVQAVLAWNMRREPFGDVRVRRALTLAINRQELIDGALHGFGQLANSPVPPIHWAYDPSTGADLKHDPARARELLRQAGWEDRDGDGILESANGRPFRFTAITPRADEMLGVIQADLRKIGVAMEIEVLDMGTFLDRIGSKRRDFDAVTTGIAAEFRIDVRGQFHCGHLAGTLQLSGYCNPEADRLLDTTQVMLDRNAARPVWRQLQHRIAHDLPYTFLFFVERTLGVSKRLRDSQPDARGELQNIIRWWIRPSERAPTGAAVGVR